MEGLRQRESNKEVAKWDSCASNYSRKVYSVTEDSNKTQRLIEKIREKTRVLIVGCGCETYLQERISEQLPEIKVIATDYSKQMLEKAEDGFSHSNLLYQYADTRDLSEIKQKYDSIETVITTHSIIPETRKDVLAMMRSCFNVLVDGGELIGYFPSFPAAEDVLSNFPKLPLGVDPINCRVASSDAWQCFYREDLLHQELSQAGFSVQSIEKVPFESQAELEQCINVYSNNINLLGDLIGLASDQKIELLQSVRKVVEGSFHTFSVCAKKMQ